jgi:amidase
MADLGASLPADDDGYLARAARFGTARHRDWLVANERRHHYCAGWRAFFREHDVLLCPANPVAAIPHDHSGDFFVRTIQVNGGSRPYSDQLAWAGIVTMAFLPSTAAPVGRTPGGLPVGVQIVGPYLEDRTPIDVARRMADVVGGFEPPPGF